MHVKYLNADRYFSADKQTRKLARHLYALVEDNPIISPHGHTDPKWFAENKNFTDPVALFIIPDHYILRMLYSHGIKLENLGVKPTEGAYELDKRKIWRSFAKLFYLFRGTPSALWLKYVLHAVFKIDKEFTPDNADYFYDVICARLKTKAYSPRSLFTKFNIEVLATTDESTDPLMAHQKIQSEWGKRVIPTYRPDAVIDPEHEDFKTNLALLGEITNEDVLTWQGYLNAHHKRRAYFKKHGATATDHGHPTPATLQLSKNEATALFDKIYSGQFSIKEAEKFRAHMLWQMASMSLDDGLVMQLHPGSYRNHNPYLFKQFGRDVGADIPMQVEFTQNLKPLLDSFGNEAKLQLILFTLDESVYSRELATLAGHYPGIKLGPAWWFHDSPEGMLRHRKQTIETAGFYNITGFIDDTRAFFSIPARHDLARRMDARVLAELVVEHRLSKKEAEATIIDITGQHAKACFRL